MATFYVGKDKVSWNAVMLRIGSYFPYVNGTGVRGIPGDPKHFVHYHSGDDEYKINEKPDSAYNYFGCLPKSAKPTGRHFFAIL